MTPSFRHLARESVGRARAELASGDRARLKFAALELRMAIESVTYERAHSYRDEIPQAEYRTWQPKKVMHPHRFAAPAHVDQLLAIGQQLHEGGHGRRRLGVRLGHEAEAGGGDQQSGHGISLVSIDRGRAAGSVFLSSNS